MSGRFSTSRRTCVSQGSGAVSGLRMVTLREHMTHIAVHDPLSCRTKLRGAARLRLAISTACTRGHQAVLATRHRRTRRALLAAAVFEPHPRRKSFFAGERTRFDCKTARNRARPVPGARRRCATSFDIAFNDDVSHLIGVTSSSQRRMLAGRLRRRARQRRRRFPLRPRTHGRRRTVWRNWAACFGFTVAAASAGARRQGAERISSTMIRDLLAAPVISTPPTPC